MVIPERIKEFIDFEIKSKFEWIMSYSLLLNIPRTKSIWFEFLSFPIPILNLGYSIEFKACAIFSNPL